MSDPITPDEMQQIRDWIATPPRAHVDDLIYRALDQLERAEALRARLDAAEAERDAALDSPEGVVTLDGKQWRVEGQRWSVTMGEDGVWDGEGMPPGTYVCLVPYQPEDPKHG